EHCEPTWCVPLALPVLLLDRSFDLESGTGEASGTRAIRRLSASAHKKRPLFADVLRTQKTLTRPAVLTRLPPSLTLGVRWRLAMASLGESKRLAVASCNPIRP